MRSSKVGINYILNGMTKFQSLLYVSMIKHKIIPTAIHKLTVNQLSSCKKFLPIDLQDFHFYTHQFFIYINPILRFTIFRVLSNSIFNLFYLF